MSSYVFMRFLESSPERYDRGIRWLSGGAIDSIYEAIAERVASPGATVLDVGCGTGGVSLACARRGARVIGIDINAGMLEVARRKAAAANVSLDLRLAGAMEIEDQITDGGLDAVVSCLVFSELIAKEQQYVLAAAYRTLRPGGRMVVADEVEPGGWPARLHRWRRLPLAAVTFLLTGATTRPVRGLASSVAAAGFAAVEEHNHGLAFAVVTGQRP